MKNFKQIFSEILISIVGFFGTTIDSKIGLGIFLLFLGVASIFIETVNFEEKEEFILRILGFVFLIFSFLLFYFRIKEIRKINK